MWGSEDMLKLKRVWGLFVVTCASQGVRTLCAQGFKSFKRTEQAPDDNRVPDTALYSNI